MNHLRQQVDAWNAKHKLGCKVTYRRDDGSDKSTYTRSRATVLSNHDAVVWLENIVGCVLLDRVTPVSSNSSALKTTAQQTEMADQVGEHQR